MISRVASHCFWLGRYLERAESMARMLFVTRNLALDAELSPRQCWKPVLIVSGEEPRFVAKLGEAAVEDADVVQQYLTWNTEHGLSIASSIASARENARSIREVVSLETWEAVNTLHLWMQSPVAMEDYSHNRYSFFRHIREQSQLCLGVIRNTMLHDNAFDFISLGLLLERVGQTARILDTHYHAFSALQAHQVVETALWISILRACSGFEPFMKRNQGLVTPKAVAGFLIQEPLFPRSLDFCLHIATKRLKAIRPAQESQLPGGQAQARLTSLWEWLTHNAPSAVEQGDIHSLLVHVVDETAEVCEDIGRELLGSAA
jgi:uncharacterized alpha-E superfamily protein